MIVHIVFFRLKDSSPENMGSTADLIRSLDGKIPQIKRIEAGVDFVRGERNYDVSLYSEFDSVEDLDAYRVHPEHKVVVEQLKARSESIVAVDYER